MGLQRFSVGADPLQDVFSEHAYLPRFVAPRDYLISGGPAEDRLAAYLSASFRRRTLCPSCAQPETDLARRRAA
jgi:hypothetical protein